MSSSTSDLSLFGSFEKDSNEQQMKLELPTATSNLSGTAADTTASRPGKEVLVKIGCRMSAVVT